MNDKTKKKTKKKSFYFEDYTESETIIKNKNTKLAKVSLSGVTFLFLVFLNLIFIFSIKILYLSLHPEKNFFLELRFQNGHNLFLKMVQADTKLLAFS